MVTKKVSYTGGNRVPLQPELVGCKPFRARPRERHRFLGGVGGGGLDSVVYGYLVLEEQNEPIKLWLLEITRRITLV